MHEIMVYKGQTVARCAFRMNKDFKFICNVQEQIIFGAVMRAHDSIREQMNLFSQSFTQIIYFV